MTPSRRGEGTVGSQGISSCQDGAFEAFDPKKQLLPALHGTLPAPAGTLPAAQEVTPRGDGMGTGGRLRTRLTAARALSSSLAQRVPLRWDRSSRAGQGTGR